MFNTLQKSVQKQFEKVLAGGVLYRVASDRDKIWEVYLNGFSEELKQEHNCNCCKSFIRQYGGIVSIKDGVISTLWDIDTDPIYAEPIKALKKYVTALAIEGLFFSENVKAGVEKNLDKVRNVIWNHFYLEIPRNFVKKDCGETCSQATADKEVLKRSLEEISDDAVETVLELIGQGSLYRGNEYKGAIQSFQKVKVAYKKIKNVRTKELFCWEQSRNLGPAVSRIKNTAIGTLLVDLTKGDDLDKAVGAFERMVAPTNYKRPTSLVTPKMVEAAKERLQELGLVGALKRRQLSDRDLNVNNSLFVFRKNTGELDIFDEIKKDVSINPKTLSKVEEISIDDFIKNVLPTAKGISALVENSHFGNFVSLVGPQDADSGNLLKWNNDYSWSYSGEVADSIKERVKEAGGKVDGVLRVSLSWSNHDDLDLHLIEPDGNKVYYASKTSPSGATLDVDMNAGHGTSRTPVENIYWKTLPKKGGEYQVVVNQFSKRENWDDDFTVEIEFDGELYHFSGKNGNVGHNHKIVKFTYDKNGFKIASTSEIKAYNSKEKWGVKTGQWTKVKAVTLSPNFWGGQTGNKQYYFFLEGCKADENIRPFYNEQLKEELSKDRKVFEVLGSRIKVEPVEDELSGLGFADSVRNHLFFEVEGKFKRILKVKF